MRFYDTLQQQQHRSFQQQQDPLTYAEHGGISTQEAGVKPVHSIHESSVSSAAISPTPPKNPHASQLTPKPNTTSLSSLLRAP
jgi:hypothetical protein